jgi:putative nucleotidyltransferase with HDIG domain
LLREPPTETAREVRRAALADLDRPETFPVLSDTAVQLTTLADRPDVSVAEVAALIRRDGMLAARVLRAANSAAVGARGTVDDVPQAVNRLGVRECARLLCAVGMRGMYASYAPVVRERCDALLKHSLFVARIAGGISKLAGVSDLGPAFTAGLLHDIGRVILCVKCGETADPLPATETDDTPDDERAAYGIDHCAIGYQFATRNRLPEGVIRVTLNHHRPEEEHFARELVALVSLAERVANHVQQKHTIADYDLTACPRFEVLSLGWGAKHEAKFRAGLGAVTVQALRDTRRMLRAVC